MKQAIGNGRGTDIILRYSKSQDVIVVFHEMFKKIHYGGDLQTFMTQMDDILNTDLTRGYPGGPLEYLAN